MFTGIVQGVGILGPIRDHDSIRTFEIEFPEGFCEGLAVGASVSVDGVCLTVTKILSPTRASFDVILQSLNVTTLSAFRQGDQVNVERAAKDGAEIGGHPLSGHVDFKAQIESVSVFDGNKVIRFTVPSQSMRYIFAKGYIAVNGCSLTVSEADKRQNWFEVWLIPETRRMTTFEAKNTGDAVNIEIERATQVVVDTVRDAVSETLGRMQPVLEALLAEKGLKVEDFIPATKLLNKG
ncbi:MAG: riboflavin synthase [Micavibrio aeruginosavorus]|uniref:Riboflavin synthase n=1 Tax=Micavibrio aeruginosavorus TaxID=349221 RepID=A0A2W5PRH5_9BACT|nr:MAG: riboflavin synthase [Micavibrio aeruginosavorus]